MPKNDDPARDQAKMALDYAMKRVGKQGWKILSPEMREAFVAREIISLIFSQVPSTLEKEPSLKHFRDTARVAFDILESEES